MSAEAFDRLRTPTTADELPPGISFVIVISGPDGLVVKPAPMSVVAENGKIWGVYRNADGTIYREEIKEKSKDDVPAPPPDAGRLMTAEVRKK